MLRVVQGENFVVKVLLVDDADSKTPKQGLGGDKAAIDCAASAASLDTIFQYYRPGTEGNSWDLDVSAGGSLQVFDDIFSSETNIVFVNGVTTVAQVEAAVRAYGGRLEIRRTGTASNVLASIDDEFIDPLTGGTANADVDVWASLGGLPWVKVWGADSEDSVPIEEAPQGTPGVAVVIGAGFGEYRLYVPGSMTAGFLGEMSFHLQPIDDPAETFDMADVRVQVVEADSLSAIAGAVWDEDREDHETVGTFGEGVVVSEILSAALTAVLNKFLTYSHRPGRTFLGWMRRTDALAAGKATGLRGLLVRFFAPDGTTEEFRMSQDRTAGTRTVDTVSGSETP